MSIPQTPSAAAPAAAAPATSSAGAAQTASAAATPAKDGQGPAAGAAAAAPPAATSSSAPQDNNEGASEEGESLLGSAKADAQATKPGEQKPGNEGTKEEKQQASGAPESYSDFTLPEGIEADQAVLDQFKGIAKELNLSQEAAQKLVDIQAQATKMNSEAAQSQWKATVDGWKKETIQSLGSNHAQELSFAAKFIDRYGSPELRQFLNQTGVGNHKELTALFVKAGKAISEDSLVDNNAGPSSREKTPAQVLYANH